MNLVHLTLAANGESIKRSGLIRSKKYDLTSFVTEAQNELKPEYLPDFIDLNKGVYLSSMERAFVMQKYLYPEEILIAVKVSSKDLDKERLFAASADKSQAYADVISNICDKKFNQDYQLKSKELIKLTTNSENYTYEEIKKCLYDFKNVNFSELLFKNKDFIYDKLKNEYKDCIIDYWNSFIPFDEYQKSRSKLSYLEKWKDNYEIIYFDDIPVTNFKIITDFGYKDII